jgi:hypothetical protein
MYDLFEVVFSNILCVIYKLGVWWLVLLFI